MLIREPPVPQGIAARDLIVAWKLQRQQGRRGCRSTRIGGGGGGAQRDSAP
eukprot:CAMPEP_0197588590 /NCGR_PEP_ID=MMETSP1326-20131121/9821_1 /TAXON_ID=1155430 /ORGANISM="Genus nov. species nov., Strain RCC2288" /LENGTH=50 /DNA_ID=CAMNT_0043153433 /DNA_START=1140 /DNA_END=1292 /DNA_ORIENTATION=+